MLRYAVILLSVIVLVPLVLAQANNPIANLTADQIVAKNVEARGGLASWRAIQSMTMSGRMDAGKRVELPFRLELRRPRMMRLEIGFKDQLAVQVYDGVEGWKVKPFLGRKDAEVFSPEELAAAEAQADLDGYLVDYARKGFKLQLLGREPLEGRQAYKLKLLGPNNVTRQVWVDAGTFLEVKVDGPQRIRGKERQVGTYYRDYKPVGGLLFPHLLETAVQGNAARHKLVVDKIELNPILAKSRFEKP
jgi:hypothetical protein